MYYIYEYIDPRTGSPFYVGKGKGNRKFNHLRNEKESRQENVDKFNVIQEILAAGLFPVIREIESNIEKEADAYEREDYWILHYGRLGLDKNGILTNKTLHGHPPTPVWDSVRKKKHSEWNSKYWTEDRKSAHRLIAKQNALKGGLASIGMVSVIDVTGKTKKITREAYNLINKDIPIEERDLVSTASKEGKRRVQYNLP
jgi:hypothetical protein